MERFKKYIVIYVLGLFESDLLEDMKYFENELIENDIIASDNNITYNWNKNGNMEINIENKGIVKKFELEIKVIEKN